MNWKLYSINHSIWECNVTKSKHFSPQPIENNIRNHFCKVNWPIFIASRACYLIFLRHFFVFVFLETSPAITFDLCKWSFVYYNMLLYWGKARVLIQMSSFFPKSIFRRNPPLLACRESKLKWPYFVLIALVLS